MIFDKYQQEVIDYIENESGHLIANAKAGVGKSTVILEAVKRIPTNKRVLLIAFNKHIAEHLKSKVPDNVWVSTTHSLGWSAIKKKYKVTESAIDENKVSKVINKLSKKWHMNDVKDIGQYLNLIEKIVNLSRLTISVTPTQIENLAVKHDIKLNIIDINRVINIMNIVHADTLSFDFNDMICMTALKKEIFIIPFDVVIVDELQDFGRTQLLVALKAVKPKFGRLIMVGDENQAIYNFLISDFNAFKYIKKVYPTIKELDIPICYRCDKNIIRKAQEIVPTIQYSDISGEGIVRTGSILDEAKTGDFVLCRTTEPLIELLFELISVDKKAYINGRDIGKDLEYKMEKHIDKTNGFSLLIIEERNVLNDIRNKLLNNGVLDVETNSEFINYQDRVKIYEFLNDKFSGNIKEALNSFKKIFTKIEDGIVLSTIHKSKGSEADRVFIIRTDLMPMKTAQAWQAKQEKNLMYVAYTRAKKELIFDESFNPKKNEK